MGIEWAVTVDDLKDPALEGQIELVDGKMVQLPFHTMGESLIVGNILFALKKHEDQVDVGQTLTSTIVYVVDLPHRKTFSPDASFTVIFPKDPMDFIPGPPIFSAEVRGPDELTSEADSAFARKRADYFAAGTQVVWDVDPIRRTVTSYRADRPGERIIFSEGDRAHAEPALPSWSVAVTDLFVRKRRQ